MVVIESKLEDKEFLDEIRSSFLGNVEQVMVNALDGNDLIQVIVPITSIVAPLVATTVQRIFVDNRVTIKFEGIEISTMGYEKAMKMLKEVQQMRETEKVIDNEYR